MGIPKTGVFGLYDLIGIDLMSDVAKSLESILPEQDEFHDVSAEIPEMVRMIEDGLIGNKGGQGGFYQPADVANGVGRKTLDFKNFSYRDYVPCEPDIDHNSKHRQYYWEVMSSALCYAATLGPARQ